MLRLISLALYLCCLSSLFDVALSAATLATTFLATTVTTDSWNETIPNAYNESHGFRSVNNQEKRG